MATAAAAATQDYVNPAAPVHIQSGIGGINGQDSFEAEPRDWDAFRDLEYHRGYGQFTVYNASYLYFAQYDAVTHEVVDEVEIRKNVYV